MNEEIFRNADGQVYESQYELWKTAKLQPIRQHADRKFLTISGHELPERGALFLGHCALTRSQAS